MFCLGKKDNDDDDFIFNDDNRWCSGSNIYLRSDAPLPPFSPRSERQRCTTRDKIHVICQQPEGRRRREGRRQSSSSSSSYWSGYHVDVDTLESIYENEELNNQSKEMENLVKRKEVYELLRHSFIDDKQYDIYNFLQDDDDGTTKSTTTTFTSRHNDSAPKQDDSAPKHDDFASTITTKAIIEINTGFKSESDVDEDHPKDDFIVLQPEFIRHGEDRNLWDNAPHTYPNCSYKKKTKLAKVSKVPKSCAPVDLSWFNKLPKAVKNKQITKTIISTLAAIFEEHCKGEEWQLWAKDLGMSDNQINDFMQDETVPRRLKRITNVLSCAMRNKTLMEVFDALKCELPVEVNKLIVVQMRRYFLMYDSFP